MEATFSDQRLAVHNDRLRDTVQVVPVKSADEEFFESEINEDRLLVIDNDQSHPDDIEIVFRMGALGLKVAGISLNIANCPKCEVFTGDHFEYQRVENGLKQDDMPELDVYKYEITFSSTLHSVLSLKFKSTGKEVLIFGIDAFVCPFATGDPSKPSTSSSIDLHKVEEMLSQSSLGISPAAERCKDFLKSSLNRPTVPQLPPALNSNISSQLAFQLIDQKLKDMEQRIISHIDSRFQSLEKRFSDIEKRLQ